MTGMKTMAPNYDDKRVERLGRWTSPMSSARLALYVQQSFCHVEEFQVAQWSATIPSLQI